MEKRSQKSKTDEELNQGLRQTTTGMQFRPRILGPQTIVQRLKNRGLNVSQRKSSQELIR
jgi:hypothetical protein